LLHQPIDLAFTGTNGKFDWLIGRRRFWRPLSSFRPDMAVLSLCRRRNLEPDGQRRDRRSRPVVMSGYWGDEPATRAALQEGWLMTGDLGVMDDDGC
jgi:acyl-coenzyme A synthetase/AMP-(fatty) acid ligase